MAGIDRVTPDAFTCEVIGAGVLSLVEDSLVLISREPGLPKVNEIPDRPRRTRAHVIASQSRNYIEKFFIDKGHTADRPSEDYGYDLIVSTFDEQGYAESGEIRVQLKASDAPKFSKDKSFISVQVTRKHVELWANELMPVFLILYDASERKAYWFDVGEYVDAQPSHTLYVRPQTLTLNIPVANTFTEATVDFMRACKLKVLGVRRASRDV
jgi:hypothetical protein